MISGRDALHRIDGAIASARRNVSDANDAARSGAARLAVIGRNEADAYKALAAIRIDVLQSDENIQTIGRADDEAQRHILDHEAYLQSAARALEEAETKIETLEAERRRQEEVVDNAIAEHDRAADVSREQLEQDQEYQSRADALEEANAIAQRAAQKLELAKADRDEKGAPYESDPLFAYLWDRKFGSKDYRAFPLFAILDRWVARIIKYRDARLNYDRLLELPERLSDHAARVDEAAAQIEGDLEAFERQALERDGVTMLRNKVKDVQKRLTEIDAEIAAAEEDHLAHVKTHRDAAAGRIGPMSEARKILADDLSRRSIPDLRILAAATTTLEDDRLVDELIRLKRERMEIDESRHAIGRSLDQQERVLSDMEKLRRKFKSSRFDSPYSEFTEGGVVAIVLNELLRGALNYGEAWRRIQRAQRTRRRDWSDDFGGDVWRDGFGLPQRRSNDWGRGGNWGGGNWGGGSRRSRTRPMRIPRAPRAPRGPRRGGGGFRTGGGF